MEEKNNEIQKLKSDITNYTNEINKLKSEKQKLDNDLNVYINENQNLKNINNELTNKLKLLESKNANNNLNNQMVLGKDNITPLVEELKIKENNKNELNVLKDLIPVIFQSMDQKKTYAIICKKTDKFNKIEDILYEKVPEFEESDNYENNFTIKGRRILKSRTIAQNKINYSDIVIVNKVEI